MSRIGKKPVAVPNGVKIVIKGREVMAEGPKGKLTQALPTGIEAEYKEAQRQVLLKRLDDSRQSRAYHGLARSQVVNLVAGCAEGFSKSMELHGTGYNVKAEGQNLVLAVGYNHPVKIPVPAGLAVKVDQPANPGKFTVSGCDKCAVGQLAAKIRKVYPPEPYQGKGIRFVNEQIRRKAGKAFAAGGG